MKGMALIATMLLCWPAHTTRLGHCQTKLSLAGPLVCMLQAARAYSGAKYCQLLNKSYFQCTLVISLPAF